MKQKLQNILEFRISIFLLAEPGPSDVYVYGQSVNPLGSYLSGLDLGGESKVSGSQIVE